MCSFSLMKLLTLWAYISRWQTGRSQRFCLGFPLPKPGKSALGTRLDDDDDDDDDDCEDLVMTGADLSWSSAWWWWWEMIVMIVMTWQELIYRPPGDDNEKLDCDDNDDDEDVWTASGFDKKSVREVARAAGKYFIYGNHNMLAFILASLWYLS